MTEEELTKILINIERDPVARNQLKQTKEAIIEKLGLTELGVKTLLEEDEKIRARKTVKRHTETEQEQEEQRLSPLTNYFRGTWKVELARQYAHNMTVAPTQDQRERYLKALQKLKYQIRRDWVLYCLNINRPDQDENWKDIEQIIPEEVDTI